MCVSVCIHFDTYFVVYNRKIVGSINFVDRICWFADFIQIKRIW